MNTINRRNGFRAFRRQTAASALLVAVLTLTSGVARAQRTNSNFTPATNTAVLYQPCTWFLGSDSGPLRELAAYQHYAYSEFTDDAAKLEVFATLGNYGIIQIGGNHSDDAGNLWVECYQPTAAGQAAWNARWNAICTGAVKPGGQTLICGTDVIKTYETEVIGGVLYYKAFEIVLTPNGLSKLLSPGEHAIVFVGSCFSFNFDLAMAIPNIFALEFLGYTDVTSKSKVAVDTRLFYPRLWGLLENGKAREVGSMPTSAGGSCTALGRGGFTSILDHGGPGNTTVAPIVRVEGVADNCFGGVQSFSPRNRNLPWGATYDGQVTFDTKMDTTRDPFQVVTTSGGCQSSILNAHWVGDQTIQFQLLVRQRGTVRLTVHNELARSSRNVVRLDGNGWPPNGENGMGPNQDDYVADNTCDPINAVVPATLDAQAAPRPIPPGIRLHDVQLAAAPGREEAGFVSLENQSTAALTGVSLVPSTLASESGEIPASAITFTEQKFDLPAGSSRKVYFLVRLPRNLANGSYRGPVVAGIDGQTTGIQGWMTILVNRPPVLVAEGPHVLHAGDPAEIRIRARDRQADPIILDAVLPDGVRLTDHGNAGWVLSFDDTSRMQGAYSLQISASYKLPGVAAPPKSTLMFRVLVGPARPAAITVSDANLGREAVAPGAIASAFPGNDVLAGKEVRADLVDADGRVHIVSILSVASDRMRYQVPAEAVPGTATLRIYSDRRFATGTVKIKEFAPAIYMGGSDDLQAIEASPADDGSVILTLPATGLRRVPGHLKVTVGGMEAEVLSAAPHPRIRGLDQLRLKLPKALADREDAPVVLTVDGKPWATVRIHIP